MKSENWNSKYWKWLCSLSVHNWNGFGYWSPRIARFYEPGSVNGGSSIYCSRCHRTVYTKVWEFSK